MNNPLGLFSLAPSNEQKLSKFNLSFTNYLSLPSCKYVPIGVFETLPGDRFRIENLSIFARIAPMVRPVMGDVNIHVSGFVVPKRIIDDQFEQWYSRGPRGKIHLVKPNIPLGGLTFDGDGQDYQGILSNLFKSGYGITWLSGEQNSIRNMQTVPFVIRQNEFNFFGYGPKMQIPNAYSQGAVPSTFNTLVPGLLLDYLGYPVNSYDSENAQNGEPMQDYNVPAYNRVLPYNWRCYFRERVDMYRWFAYWLIWDEYFRNQALTDPLLRDTTTGVRKHIRDIISMQNGFYHHILLSPWSRIDIGLQPFECAPAEYDNDYFTTLRPSPTLGDEVLIPSNFGLLTSQDRYPYSIYEQEDAPSPAIALFGPRGKDDPLSGDVNYSEVGSLTNFATLRDLSQAYALQKWQNVANRFNNRYDDVIFGHFGVRTSNRALQRPLYIGGGIIPIHMSDVLNTTSSEFAALGETGGRALASGNIRFSQFNDEIEEESIVIILAAIKPVALYWQGIDRQLQIMYSEDSYMPEFQHIGMQEVLTKELNIYVPDLSEYTGTVPPAVNPAKDMSLPNTDYDIFGNNRGLDDYNSILGYQSRFAYYKFMPDTIRGLARTDYKDWFISRDFTGRPSLNLDMTFAFPSDLNSAFAQSLGSSGSDAYVNRDNFHNFIFECRYSMTALRKMDFFARSY